MIDAACLPLFDSAAFARELRAAMAARPGLGVRGVAAEAHVGMATVSRASNGWPDLSHENCLRLRAWIDAQASQERNAA